MAEAELEREEPSRPRARDWTGTVLGILVFLGGIGLLVLTFRLAYDMFSVPPERALNIDPNLPVKLEDAGQRLTGLVIRVLLLLVMAIVGSLVANRGIKLYTESGPR